MRVLWHRNEEVSEAFLCGECRDTVYFVECFWSGSDGLEVAAGDDCDALGLVPEPMCKKKLNTVTSWLWSQRNKS